MISAGSRASNIGSLASPTDRALPNAGQPRAKDDVLGGLPSSYSKDRASSIMGATRVQHRAKSRAMTMSYRRRADNKSARLIPVCLLDPDRHVRAHQRAGAIVATAGCSPEIVDPHLPA
jgi:hypothetical protein